MASCSSAAKNICFASARANGAAPANDGELGADRLRLFCALDKTLFVGVRCSVTKRVLLWSGLFLIGVLLGFAIACLAGFPQSRPESRLAARVHGAVELTFTATIDGSERFIFTRDNVWNEHGRWSPPTEVVFNGQPWEDLSQAPDGWAEFAAELDLSKATILTRNGRDTIALEPTAEGFDLYLADTQMGAAKYSVTISIPRK
jgi:hypothetical protein